MSTLQNPIHTLSAARIRLGAVAVALGALVAIGVAVLILALSNASDTTSGPTVATPKAPAPALLSSKSTGRAVLNPMTGQMHGGGSTAPADAR